MPRMALQTAKVAASAMNPGLHRAAAIGRFGHCPLPTGYPGIDAVPPPSPNLERPPWPTARSRRDVEIPTPKLPPPRPNHFSYRSRSSAASHGPRIWERVTSQLERGGDRSARQLASASASWPMALRRSSARPFHCGPRNWCPRATVNRNRRVRRRRSRWRTFRFLEAAHYWAPGVKQPVVPR